MLDRFPLSNKYCHVPRSRESLVPLVVSPRVRRGVNFMKDIESARVHGKYMSVSEARGS